MTVRRVGTPLNDNYNPDAYPAGVALSDEFDDGVLNSAWSWNTAPTGTVDETTFPGNLFIDGHTTDNVRLLRRSYAPGASTAFTVVMKATPGSDPNPSNYRVGLSVLNSSDTAIYEVQLYNNGLNNNQSRRIFDIGTGAIIGGSLSTTIYLLGQRDASNVYTAYWSPDGMAWSYIGTTTSSTTVDKVAVAFVGSSGKQPKAVIDFFRVFSGSTFKIGA